jgi:DNA-directed RNA polymerase specialized sigma24 family protein
MDAPLHGKQAAELLLEYLNTSNELEAQSLLTRLITDHAAPLIKIIIRYKLRASKAEAEDVYGNAVLRLLTRLRAFKSDADSNVIHDFRSYVAGATYHACHDHLRRKYPRRRRL